MNDNPLTGTVADHRLRRFSGSDAHPGWRNRHNLRRRHDASYRADKGFAKGKFIGTDGQPHKGTFAFAGLDLYTVPVAIAPVTPIRATVSFDVEWNGIVAMAEIHNSALNFMGSFLSTGATIKWSVDEPGFHFEPGTRP